MPKLSVIVPVYNVQKFLNRCVDSILSQTFTDFEVILVDDGSTDKSGKICDDYQKKDHRIKVLHKQNGGLSDARNCGINVISGDYIGFVDSDDYIAKDMYEVLISNLEKFDADISVCGIYDCFGTQIKRQNINNGIFVMDKEKSIEYFLGGKGVGLFAVNKVYKRHVFDKVRYPVGKLYEDAFIIVDLILNSRKVVVDTCPKYFYVHRDDSITISNFNNRYYDIVHAHQKNLDIIKSKFPHLKDVAEFRLFWAYKQLLYILAFDSDKRKFKSDIKKIKTIIRKNFFHIIKNKFNSKAQLISYCMIIISPNWFMSVVRRTKKKGGF